MRSLTTKNSTALVFHWKVEIKKYSTAFGEQKICQLMTKISSKLFLFNKAQINNSILFTTLIYAKKFQTIRVKSWTFGINDSIYMIYWSREQTETSFLMVWSISTGLEGNKGASKPFQEGALGVRRNVLLGLHLFSEHTQRLWEGSCWVLTVKREKVTNAVWTWLTLNISALLVF